MKKTDFVTLSISITAIIVFGSFICAMDANLKGKIASAENEAEILDAKLQELANYFKREGYLIDNSRLVTYRPITIYADTVTEFEGFLEETETKRLYVCTSEVTKYYELYPAKICFVHAGILYVYEIQNEAK